jgi:hypothetical protein
MCNIVSYAMWRCNAYLITSVTDLCAGLLPWPGAGRKPNGFSTFFFNLLSEL